MAKAGGCAGHIHGDIAASDHQNALAQVEVIAAQVDIDQEIYCPENSDEQLTLDGQC
jgi:hypothetical protein